MKQFLSLKSTPEINSQLISEILNKRFPTYTVSLQNDSVRLRKNALVSVAVETKQESDQTIISVGTLMPWWIWVFIGWLPYLIVKRGFVDEVFSSLLRDFRLKFPDNIPACYEVNNVIKWKHKTKYLGGISIILLVWAYCFQYFMGGVLYPIIDITFKPEDPLTVYEISSFVIYLVSSCLWVALGIFLSRLGNDATKLAGSLIAVTGVYQLLCDILTRLLQFTLPNYFVHVNNIIWTVLMFSAGYFINRKKNNGALRYASIALIMLSLANFAQYVVMSLVFDYQSIFTNDDYTLDMKVQLSQQILWGTSLVFYPFCYAAYILLWRAFRKLPKYPVQGSND